MPTPTEKQRILGALEQLPEDATIEDAIERPCFIAKVQEGLKQSDQGNTVSHDEARRRILS